MASVGDVMGQMAWYLAPDGGLGRVALVDVGLGRQAGSHDRRGELWVSSAPGPVRLMADVPDGVMLPMLGTPEVWCLLRGALVRIDPLNRLVRRVANDVTVTWPARVRPAVLAFAERGAIGVLDLAARRGTWLTSSRRVDSLAAGGLAAISYERGKNVTTVSVLAEP